MTSTEIVNRIAYAMNKSGRTYQDLALSIKCSTSLLNRFILGRSSMNFDKVCRLCEELGIDIFVTGEDSPETEEENDEPEDPYLLEKEEYELKKLKIKGKRDMEYDQKLYFAYQNFANAIILLAVEDYRLLIEQGQVSKKMTDKIVSLDNIESFFKSDFYKVLTEVDGEYILQLLRKESKR